MVTPADIGAPVRDAAGRVGILRDVIPDYEDPAELPGRRRRRPMAFLRAAGGGPEWLVAPERVSRREGVGASAGCEYRIRAG
ncbi:hypothetical protein ASE09_03615 [Streptomyces sp. Root66D1]|nr:hypothetical protein ASD33_03615 [Streptomyces sp. Root1304]KRB00641.1 hypothetical protein ASE09_03615 [Streptomyces sp. Root66D1]